MLLFRAVPNLLALPARFATQLRGGILEFEMLDTYTEVDLHYYICVSLLVCGSRAAAFAAGCPTATGPVCF